MGTAAYMSPEQARGKVVDRRADVWAFGCVLYEMLVGRRAFAGDDISETMARVIEREPDWNALAAVAPRSVVRVVRRCLQKDPQNRIRDLGDVRLELRDAVAEAGQAPVAAADASRPPRNHRAGGDAHRGSGRGPRCPAGFRYWRLGGAARRVTRVVRG